MFNGCKYKSINDCQSYGCPFLLLAFDNPDKLRGRKGETGMSLGPIFMSTNNKLSFKNSLQLREQLIEEGKNKQLIENN